MKSVTSVLNANSVSVLYLASGNYHRWWHVSRKLKNSWEIAYPQQRLSSFRMVIWWSHHSNFFWPVRRYPIPRGTHSVGALINIYTGVGKTGDFRRKSPFISEMVRDIGRWLLWNVNRKSWQPDWMVSFSMTLSDPNPGFKVTVYLQVDYLKKGAFKRQSY